MMHHTFNKQKNENKIQKKKNRKRNEGGGRDQVRVEYGGTVLFREGEFVGENIEATVDLHGISIDYFDGEV